MIITIEGSMNYLIYLAQNTSNILQYLIPLIIKSLYKITNQKDLRRS